MPLKKARTFEYRPSRRRLQQLHTADDTRRRIRIPISRNEENEGSGRVVKLLVMLSAIIGLTAVMIFLR